MAKVRSICDFCNKAFAVDIDCLEDSVLIEPFMCLNEEDKCGNNLESAMKIITKKDDMGKLRQYLVFRPYIETPPMEKITYIR